LGRFDQFSRTGDERVDRTLDRWGSRESRRRRARCYAYSPWYDNDATTLASGHDNTVPLRIKLKLVAAVDFQVDENVDYPKLVYVGTEPIWVEVFGSISIEADGNNVRLHVGWWINGEDEVGSHNDVQFERASSDHTPVTFFCQALLKRGDYLDIRGYGGSGYDCTVEHCTISVKEI
jgi:hypothetical protein